MSEICIKEWVKRFNAGQYNGRSTATQCEAGWFDWFCKNEQLANKTQFLGKKLLDLLGSPKFDTEKTYVWFKNNCPVTGPLYDDFRIADLESDNTLYTISHLLKGCHGCDKAHWEVWGRENHFHEPIVSGNVTFSVHVGNILRLFCA